MDGTPEHKTGEAIRYCEMSYLKTTVVQYTRWIRQLCYIQCNFYCTLLLKSTLEWGRGGGAETQTVCIQQILTFKHVRYMI
jgi:hypothetical protein